LHIFIIFKLKLIFMAKYWFVKLFIFLSTAAISQSINFFIPQPDLEKLRLEDLINDQDKTKPYRFGVSYSVDVDMTENPVSEFHTLRKVYKIQGQGAKSLNFLFKEIELAPNAQLIIKNEQGKELLGPYTSSHNNKSHILATGVLKDSVAIIELIEYGTSTFKSKVTLTQVTYGYRSLWKSYGLGDSGPCNINTICPDGDDWRDQIRSVVMTLEGGFTLCSGALINNTCSDGRPYYLTANHCLTGTEDEWAFVFNWESPSCSLNLDGSINNTVSGAEVRAKSSSSDFALLELFSVPPDNYNPYYSGFDASGIIPSNETTIHHPAGDVKKISKDFDPVTMSGNYWRIADWDLGTTEGGSSGSPLFNQDKKIIGQLQGGAAACWNNDYDQYGRLDVSWDAIAGISNQLMPWLDACSTGEVSIDGFDPINFIADTNDIAIIDIMDVAEVICEHEINASIVVKNTGLDTVFSFMVQYFISSHASGMTWNGILPPNSTETLFLPAIPLMFAGIDTLRIVLMDPNGMPDDYLMNNTRQYSFYHMEDPVPVYFKLNTDDWGSETTWSISNGTGFEFASGGPYSDVSGGQLKQADFCLQRDDCYIFKIFDTYGDGISDDNGYYLIYNAYVDTLAYILNENFGYQESQSFCAEDTLTIGINKIQTENAGIHFFPNPSNGTLWIKNEEKGNYMLQIFDLLGRSWLKQGITKEVTEIETNLANGEYLVCIYDNNQQIIKRLPWIVIR
jgi:lysyl endopeptidase